MRESTAVLNPVDERARELVERRRALHDAIEPAPAAPDVPRDQPESPAPSVAERDELLLQIQTLSADLHALIAELHERGLIGAGWRGAEVEREQESLSR